MRLALGFLVLLASLSACAPYTQEWSPAQSPKRNVVNWVEVRHPVAFAGGAAELAPADRAALERFVGRQARGESVRITVAAADPGSPLAVRRETAVAAHLRSLGLDATLGPVAADAANPSAVVVSVGRFVVTPPSCPDWSKSAGGDPANTTGSNFGCASAVNLGLMVADPGHLVRGAAMGPGDGDALAKGIRDYRGGKSEKPAPVTTLSITGGAASGGAQ
jgi:pilus assembly protein CpaD